MKLPTACHCVSLGLVFAWHMSASGGTLADLTDEVEKQIEKAGEELCKSPAGLRPAGVSVSFRYCLGVGGFNTPACATVQAAVFPRPGGGFDIRPYLIPGLDTGGMTTGKPWAVSLGLILGQNTDSEYHQCNAANYKDGYFLNGGVGGVELFVGLNDDRLAEEVVRWNEPRQAGVAEEFAANAHAYTQADVDIRAALSDIAKLGPQGPYNIQGWIELGFNSPLAEQLKARGVIHHNERLSTGHVVTTYYRFPLQEVLRHWIQEVRAIHEDPQLNRVYLDILELRELSRNTYRSLQNPGLTNEERAGIRQKYLKTRTDVKNKAMRVHYGMYGFVGQLFDRKLGNGRPSLNEEVFETAMRRAGLSAGPVRRLVAAVQGQREPELRLQRHWELDYSELMQGIEPGTQSRDDVKLGSYFGKCHAIGVEVPEGLRTLAMGARGLAEALRRPGMVPGQIGAFMQNVMTKSKSSMSANKRGIPNLGISYAYSAEGLASTLGAPATSAILKEVQEEYLSPTSDFAKRIGRVAQAVLRNPFCKAQPPGGAYGARLHD